MNDSRTPSAVTDERLVQALDELRLALLGMSLLLQDMEFQIDLARRIEASAEAHELMQKLRNG